MNKKLFLPLLAFAGLLILTACGGGGGSDPAAAKNTLHESEVCIACHEGSTWKTPGSGQPVVTEWYASTHNTNNGASCQDCHTSGYLHPASCAKCHSMGGVSVNPTRNPDAAGSCLKCHSSTVSKGFISAGYDGISNNTQFLHFSTGHYRGNYVALNYQNNCRKCHNPHNTTFGKEQRQQWARSGHGNTRSAALISAQFNPDGAKGKGSRLQASANFGSYCVRCHTTTGFINFVASGFSDVQTLPDSDGVRKYPTTTSLYIDNSNEPTNCNACHDDGRSDDTSAYSGRLRSVAAASIWYMYSSHPSNIPVVRAKYNVQYDSLGNSNLCVPCHAGREVGEIIKIADIDWDLFNTTASNPAGIRPHDFPAAANLQGKGGFNFYTSSAKYNKNPSHKNGAYFTGAGGACIGCHMKNDRPHYFRAVEWSGDNQSGPIESVISASVCANCHNGSAGMSVQTVAKMNEERDYYRAAVAALGTSTMVPSNTNWKTRPLTLNAIVAGSGTRSSIDGSIKNVRGGAYTMGAYFVQVLFFNDPGGYVHNPIYTKQLIYDAIDWLADGKMDYGNASAQVRAKVNAIAVNTLYWRKGSPSVDYGQLGVPITSGGLYFTNTQVLKFICKDYDSDPTVCNRW